MAVLKISFTILSLTFLLSVSSDAEPYCDKKELVVGGKETSWEIPPLNNSFDGWRQIGEFIVGDSLTFKYDNKTDSVLEVNREDYLDCETSKPIKEYRDGNTTIELDRPGNYYFISKAEGHCEKGQKLEIYTEIDAVCYWRARHEANRIIQLYREDFHDDDEEEDHDGHKRINMFSIILTFFMMIVVVLTVIFIISFYRRLVPVKYA